jgi:YD repeat-containing protein
MDRVMVGVKEYDEGMDVKLYFVGCRPTILALNEAGHNSTRVDLIQLLEWVQINMPELMDVPKRVPLTDGQIKECSYDDEGFMVEREAAMRNVERAHGIGEKE